MKKSIIKAITLFASIATVACSQDTSLDNTIVAGDDTINRICITGKNWQFEDNTRSQVSITDSGASFLWGEDDVIGIFPDKGDQVSFAMEQGAGTQTATFTGGGWALKSSAKYAAYYPHVYENRDMTVIPVSYVGQTQNGNNNTDHIGAYDFMATSVTTPSNGAVAFDMQHLGCLVQLTINVAEPSKLICVTLDTEADFVQTGTVDLSDETPAISAKSLSESFRINLTNIVTTKASEEVTIYFMMPPIDLANKTLKAIIEKDNHYYQEIELTGKNFEAGKAYKLTAKMASEEDVPTAINVETAGSFEATIRAKYGSSLFELTSLKVIGNLNGTDIRFLRKMAGRAEDGATYASGKNLIHLDLTDANIVAGGDYYYMPRSGTKYYTENNVAGDYMFYFCNLETIKFPNSITKLGANICSHLSKPDGNEVVEDNHIGTFISIIIPTGVTTMGSFAFAWNQNLKTIEIPDSVKEMGYHTFYRCDSLTTINIPNSVEKDGAYTFMWCSGLQHVHISENVKYTRIGGWSFLGCQSLTKLTIPANITTINSEAFGNTTTPSILKEVHFKSTIPPSLHANSGLPSNCKIYVPAGSYSTYKSTNTFKNYTIIEE